MADFILAAFADEAGVSLAEQIKAMKNNGIDYLEIRAVDGENISKFTAEKTKEIKKQLDDAGLGVWSIGSPSGKIRIDEDFEPHLDEFKHMLELADILEAKHYRLFSFYGTEGDEKYFDPVCERLEKFCDAANGSDIVLCHENEKGIYGDTAARCLQILKAVPRLKGIFDPANFIQCSEDTLKAWDMLAPYIEYMHIKDAGADGKIVPPGHGNGNIAEIIGKYAAQGGRILTLEPHLFEFVGLQDLEEEGDKTESAYLFDNSQEAFACAVTELKKLF